MHQTYSCAISLVALVFALILETSIACSTSTHKAEDSIIKVYSLFCFIFHTANLCFCVPYYLNNLICCILIIHIVYFLFAFFPLNRGGRVGSEMKILFHCQRSTLINLSIYIENLNMFQTLIDLGRFQACPGDIIQCLHSLAC